MEFSVDSSQDLAWVLDKLSAAKRATPKAVPQALTVPTLSKAEKKKQLTSTKETELELWKRWKDSEHSPTHLEPLLKSLKPLIKSYSNRFTNRVEVPTASIDFEHTRLAVQALKSFDPKKGVKLGSWVGTNLQKAGRFISYSQNIARIPENISRHIGTYQAVKADLTNRLGFEPDDITLHEEVQKVDPRVTMGVLKRLNKEIRKGLIESSQEGMDLVNSIVKDDRHKEVVHLIWHQLTPQERVVHEYTFGLNGKKPLGTGQIAKVQKWDASKVSKLKTSIFGKMKPFLGE